MGFSNRLWSVSSRYRTFCTPPGILFKIHNQNEERRNKDMNRTITNHRRLDRIQDRLHAHGATDEEGQEYNTTFWLVGSATFEAAVKRCKAIPGTSGMLYVPLGAKPIQEAEWRPKPQRDEVVICAVCEGPCWTERLLIKLAKWGPPNPEAAYLADEEGDDRPLCREPVEWVEYRRGRAVIKKSPVSNSATGAEQNKTS